MDAVTKFGKHLSDKIYPRDFGPNSPFSKTSENIWQVVYILVAWRALLKNKMQKRLLENLNFEIQGWGPRDTDA